MFAVAINVTYVVISSFLVTVSTTFRLQYCTLNSLFAVLITFFTELEPNEMLNVITIIVSKMTSHCAGTVQMREKSDKRDMKVRREVI